MADQPQPAPRRARRSVTPRATRRASHLDRRRPLRPRLDVHEGMNDYRCAPSLHGSRSTTGGGPTKPILPSPFCPVGPTPRRCSLLGLASYTPPRDGDQPTSVRLAPAEDEPHPSSSRRDPSPTTIN